MKSMNTLISLFIIFFVFRQAFAKDERGTDTTGSPPRYLVLATSRMTTLNTELDRAVAQGYVFAFG